MRMNLDYKIPDNSIFGNSPFIPGSIPEDPIPLNRYLPPVSFGAVSSWAESKINPGDWILDPLCGSPWTAIELANAGFNLLVAAHNPVLEFLIEFLADPPSEKEFKAALSALAFETRGEMRIEQFINSLYLTDCIQCGAEIPVEAFIWDREANFPSQKIYHCPICLEGGTFPTTDRDINRLIQFGSVDLHIARASERIAVIDDPDREAVEAALSIYLPRTIYAILTLINRYDNIPEIHRKPLSAILLAVFDKATVLWPFPHEKYRPKKLAPVSTFRENNIWLELENELDNWIKGIRSFPYKKEKLPITIWPETLSETGNICIYRGKFKDLAQLIQKGSDIIPINAVISTIPRPNQAFWSLSAIWAGLLWGRDSASRIKGVLRRKRFDWTWYCSALNKTFSSLTKSIEPDTQLFGIITEPESSFLGAVLTNAWVNNFSINNIATRLESNEIQIQWTKESENQISKNRIAGNIGASLKDHINFSINKFLSCVKEPAQFITLYGYGLFSYFQTFTPDFPKFNLPASDFYNLADNVIQELLSSKTKYSSSGRSEHSLENARFWYSHPDNQEIFKGEDQLTLVDRTEMEILKVVIDEGEIPFKLIDQRICLALPGLLTQEIETIYECINSYARELDGKDVWRIRKQDLFENRIKDIFQMQEILVDLGSKLNFQIFKINDNSGDMTRSFMPQSPVVVDWKDEEDENHIRFYIISTAIIANIILANTIIRNGKEIQRDAVPNNIIVLPGGRSNLIRYKIQRDFRFRELSEQNWLFLKFRHLRRLHEDKSLTFEKFNQNLFLDPLANTDPQITFL